MYIYENIGKKYDVAKLKERNEKDRKESKATEESYQHAILILTGFILILGLGFFIQYTKRQRYKKRFDAIVQQKEQRRSNLEAQEENITTIQVPKEVIENILEGLQLFEKELGFTSKEITLGFLAKKFNTNANYLSKVVNHFKGSSFSTYINNLRIDYCVKQLQSDSSYHRYTIKAISQEMGFNNVQSFNKAFFKSKGINPSYFLKELRKMES